jgi:hypothetical protein
MLILEAALLQSIIDRIAPVSILDCGSGTKADRTIVQPHISAAFAGHNVTWTNLHSENGDEIVCDFTKPETLKNLPRCELVTACSMLEHVEDIDGAMKSIAGLADDWLIVTAPFSYPLHKCPIDNGWRPNPDQLAEKVEAYGFTVIQKYVAGPEQFGGVADATESIVLARRTEAKDN